MFLMTDGGVRMKVSNVRKVMFVYLQPIHHCVQVRIFDKYSPNAGIMDLLLLLLVFMFCSSF